MESLVTYLYFSPVDGRVLRINALDRQLLINFFEAVLSSPLAMPVFNQVEANVSNMAA